MQHRPYNHSFSAFNGGRVGSIGRKGRQVPGVMLLMRKAKRAPKGVAMSDHSRQRSCIIFQACRYTQHRPHCWACRCGAAASQAGGCRHASGM
jgi:hypothetical protein